MTPHPALVSKSLAVITGGASGIGLAAAKIFVSRYGMNVAIGDYSGAVEEAVKQIQSEAKDDSIKVWGAKVDVRDVESVQSFKNQVQSNFENVDITVLMANAGISGASKASEWSQEWEKVLATNMYGVIHVNQIFLPLIKAHKKPSLIVNTGSKQGITTPPATGPAYNASKAVVKVFTESLAWELRNDKETKQIHTALLIPGFVWTGLTGSGSGKPKPEGAFTPEETVDFMLKRLEEKPEVFYILCPDNETPRQTDLKRMQWNVSDIIEDRPALSRWHDDYSEKFSKYSQ